VCVEPGSQILPVVFVLGQIGVCFLCMSCGVGISVRDFCSSLYLRWVMTLPSRYLDALVNIFYGC
jgi:hypothetical protein